MTSCSNPRCQALQHQVDLLQEEFEESKKRIASFEKIVAHLQQEKNSALEQCSFAKVEVLHVCMCCCNFKTIRMYMFGKAFFFKF